jgi:ABC-type multidrug transport system fused ATPase/permease subunit
MGAILCLSLGWIVGMRNQNIDKICKFINISGNFIFSKKASYQVHKRLMRKFVGAKISFYDTTPVGRIMSRLSLDLFIIDYFLPGRYFLTITNFFQLIAAFVGM